MAQLAVLLLALFGVHQILCQGPRTGWPVQNTGIGMNAGVPALDPTDYQIDMAVMGINTATTEAAAAQAAAAVYNPAFDMADAVKNALETRVRVLRTPPGWPHPIPPPLPFGFDVMNLITTAYYNNMNGAALQPYPAQPANAALPSYGQQPGLNQAQRTAATGMQGPVPQGIGPARAGSMYSMEPTQWEQDLAIHNINAATNQSDAARAAAAVYRIGLDTPDAVVNAFEEKLMRLRNPHWTGFGSSGARPFNTMALIIQASAELQASMQAEAIAAAQAAAQAALQTTAVTVPPPLSSSSHAINDSDSVAIPTKPTTTTTIAATTATTTTTEKPTITTSSKTMAEQTTPTTKNNPALHAIQAKSIGTSLSANANESGKEKITQLQSLLEGISASQLQSLVDLIKSRSNRGSSPAELVKADTPRRDPKPPKYEQPQLRNSPSVIPPPPGSGNRGPPREVRGGNAGSPSYGQNSEQPQYGPPLSVDGPSGPGGQDSIPQWAGNRPSRNGPPMGGSPALGGSPNEQMEGGPIGGGPVGRLDPNSPMVARLFRVLSGRTGNAVNPTTGDVPEAGEGVMNPALMAMMLGGQNSGSSGDLGSLLGLGGLGGGGGGSGIGSLASLLGGGGMGARGGLGGVGGMGAFGALGLF